MNNGRRYVVLESNQAIVIQNRYSCSECWNPVRVCHDRDGDYIECGTDGCTCRGLITTRFVDKMILESEMKARIAREVLQERYTWLKLPKRERIPTGKLMEELGF